MALKLTAASILSWALAACTAPPPANAPQPAPVADSALASFIGGIRAVDNHTHANITDPADADYDALPLEGLGAFDLAATLRPEHPQWAVARRALYDGATKPAGDAFPTWVLDRIGTEVLLANRIAMGPGLAPPRFRWVSYADALIYPLATAGEARATPDREKLFPLEVTLLRRYLADLKLSTVPATLDAYLTTVVTPTLEAQQRAGCVAIKFEAAYLRALDFAAVPLEAAARVYAAYARGGTPPHAEYKALQDFLFGYLAREAGRLGMAVHIHSFEGVGNYYDVAGADPALLEPVLNDPALRETAFVIIHGGGSQSMHVDGLLWKPNVYADISLMTLAYPPARLAAVLKRWLAQFPEKVLFGSDASALGPDLGWEVAAAAGTSNARAALALALSEMMRSGEVTRERAQEIAAMVLRGNASRLYKLELR
jgi:hypothetical protein